MGLSPDGTILVTGSRNYDERGRMLIETWEVPSGKRLSAGGIPFPPPPHFAFSPDGSILVVGDGSGAVRFWDFRTGKQTGLLYQFNDPNNPDGIFSYIISALAFSPDGSLLAAGVDKFKFAVWTVSSRQLIWRFSD
jgi:WD40 repeat protein